MEYLNLTTPYGQTYEVCFEAERYANNHNLALQMYFKDEDGMLMPYSTLTINLREPHEPNCSFLTPTITLGRKSLLPTISSASLREEKCGRDIVNIRSISLT